MTVPFDPERRRVLLAGAGMLLLPAGVHAQILAPSVAPFSLGVASGWPSATSVVLWTRLTSALTELHASDRMPVGWELAADADFKAVVARGEAMAEREWAHSVHVEVAGLDPDRWYWYRFHAQGQRSPVGRTRTLPEATARPAHLRMVFTSCQHYEGGWYGAHRHIVAEEPDFVIFLGDYIYETSYRHAVRRHPERTEIQTLDEYRRRYACYKGDPDLQAGHAACPWLVAWDDHEVRNNYPGHLPLEYLLPRRAAAYQAFWEHMPLPERLRPDGPTMRRLYTHFDFGDLVRICMLDTRQYRSPQLTASQVHAESDRLLNDPTRTMLGEAQEAWLHARLGASSAIWNVVAQQTIVSRSGAGKHASYRIASDRWDGYPAARGRLMDALRSTANPVVIGGDVHSFWVGELTEDLYDPRTPPVATELVSSSVSSVGPSARTVARRIASNPQMRYGNGAWRGYVRLDIRREHIDAALRAVYDVTSPDTGAFTLATFLNMADIPGVVRTS